MMYIIVRDDGNIWNHLYKKWEAESNSMGQAYVSPWEAKKASERVGLLLGSTGDVEIMTYNEWANKTGGVW